MPKAYVFTRYGGPESRWLGGPVTEPVGRNRRTGARRPGETGERVRPAVLGNRASGAAGEAAV
ncbi:MULTISPECIES: hypothetical protein [Streptomyces]|uniref:hypothetical protein n=1 Tax=Streptomyces TaxID=1883 RepID=UPI00292FA776|nr:hypothetical protein [Streptomyces sp. NEAU-HV9]